MNPPRVYARPSTLLASLGLVLAAHVLVGLPGWAILPAYFALHYLATPAYPWSRAGSSD